MAKKKKSFEAESPPPPPPAIEDWQGPMAWQGSPLLPFEENYHEFPEEALFVRAEVEYTLSEPVGQGMFRQTFRTDPALLRLVEGKPAEVHTVGIDGRCWSYRPVREGRKTRWRLFAGLTFPAEELCKESPLGETLISYALVQSLVPKHGTGKHVSFMIHEDGRMENFAHVTDPDRDD